MCRCGRRASQKLANGDAVSEGQVVATIVPRPRAAPLSHRVAKTTWAALLDEVRTLQALAHARFAAATRWTPAWFANATAAS